MEYFSILLLAIIQGLAELLPVSSSAHVILAAKLLKHSGHFQHDPSDPQFVFLLMLLHTGTMFSAIVYFWPAWKSLFVPPPGKGPDPAAGNGWHIAMMILLSTIATGLLGLGLKVLIENVILEKLLHHEKGEVETLFQSLPLIGCSLLAAGVLILLSSFLDGAGPGGRLTAGVALAIGLIQGICIPFRGLSRSGATISVGLLSGLPRRLAEQYVFALAVVLTPPLIAYSVYKLMKNDKTRQVDLLSLVTPGLVGMVFSFLAGLVALRLLSAVLERGHWRFFAWYCFAAAGVMFLAAWQGF
jgi:undecaprenyl-diphosphatase